MQNRLAKRKEYHSKAS